MDKKKLAADLIPLVGGKENIKSVIHCMTRLRFQLFDMKKADIAKIEQLDGVMGVKEDKEKQKFSAKLLDMISGIFAPVIPLITGAGMIKAILTILVVFGLSNTSNEYYILNFIADSGFYFFPVVLAFSSATKFGCNPYLAAMIGGVLIHPNWIALVSAGETVTFFGLPVKLFSYASCNFPTSSNITVSRNGI